MTPTRNFGIWNRGSARINGGTKDGLSAANHNGKNNAVYTQKDRQKEIYSVGVLDIERSQSPEIKPEPWQTDTCLGDWFYNVRSVYKKPRHESEPAC
jgi:alpha-L-fucosidase